MLTIVETRSFRKDFKRMKKRGKDQEKLKAIISQLANGESLDQRHRDHELSGEFEGSRECHIEPDWLLIYEVDDDELLLERTGTHSDLFD